MSKRARKGGKRADFNRGPNLGRQLIYAGITLAAMLGGYWIGVGYFAETEPPAKRSVSRQEPPDANLQAWYARQTAPPSLVKAPDAPLFPDPATLHPEEPVRAYEEALPQEIHAPRSIPLPPPATKPKAASTEPEGKAPPRDLEITVVQPPKAKAAPDPEDVLNEGARGGLTPPPMTKPPEKKAPIPEPEPMPDQKETAEKPPNLTVTITKRETTPEEPPPEPPVAEVSPKVEPIPAPGPEPETAPKPEKKAAAPAAEALAEALKPLEPEPEPAPQAAPEPETATPPSAEPQPAWRQYAALSPPTDGRPMIAVVIDDMGVDQGRSAKVSALDGPLTLSFLTYARNLDEQTRDARTNGHELMLHVPMQPSNDAVDPGPNVLRADLSDEELRERIDWALGRFTGFVGINNHMGSRFTANAHGMRLVMQALRKRSLLFLDSRTTGGTKGPETALAEGVPFLERNVFIDNVNDVAAVNERLADLEEVALSHGFAIAIGHPRDATIKALSEWMKGMRERGFVLVPLTAIMKRVEATG